MKLVNPHHTFAICAYQESPFLDACICSVVEQSIQSNIIMVTSTDNTHIRSLATQYNIPLYVNDGLGDMQDNWNFAFNMVETPFVTIVHQDDAYLPRYAECVLRSIKSNKNISMIHTNYRDLIDGRPAKKNLNYWFKRTLNLPLQIPFLGRRKAVKKFTLSFGNSVCCPSVTYNCDLLGKSPFQSLLSMAVDWELFLDVAHKPGRIVYLPEPLTYKRLHRESETNDTIQNGKRYADDVIMFEKIWPKPIAHFFVKLYTKSYDANNFG